MTIALTHLYTNRMSTVPAPVSALVAFSLLFTTLVVLPKQSVVQAQSASTSGTATQSGTATNSASTATSSSTASSSSTSSLPSSLPESGSNDVLFTFGLGAFLLLSGVIGRVTLAQLLGES